MKIQCPRCGQEYDVETSLIGQKVECFCGNKWIIVLETPIQKTKQCPVCGEEILMIAQKCRFCGEYLSEANKPVRRKDRLLYLLLGVFLGNFGAHNFYAAQYLSAFIKIVVIFLMFIAMANCAPHEPAWLSLLIVNLYLIIWDLCYDPNVPPCQHPKIWGLSPVLIKIIFPLLILLIAIVIQS